MIAAPVVVERVATGRGELALRQLGEDFEVISNGVFLMDTRNGESERLLVAAALAAHPRPRRLLIGGLGVGFSVSAALADEHVERVVVVEIAAEIVRWNRTHFAGLNDHALDDARVEVVTGDLLDYLRATDRSYDVICLDIDNGPDWTVTDRNRGLYDDAGTALVASRLRSPGVLSVWSADRSPSYESTLARTFDQVEAIDVPVPRGDPDIVYIGYRGVRR